MSDVQTALREFLNGYYLRVDSQSFVGMSQEDYDELTSGPRWDEMKRNRNLDLCNPTVTFAGWHLCVEPDQKTRFVAWEE